jgi:hypothetical protein
MSCGELLLLFDSTVISGFGGKESMNLKSIWECHGEREEKNLIYMDFRKVFLVGIAGLLINRVMDCCKYHPSLY